MMDFNLFETKTSSVLVQPGADVKVSLYIPGAATLIEGWSSGVVINPPGGAVHLKANPVKVGSPTLVIPSKL